MPINIKYSSKISNPKSGNLVLFSDEKFNVTNLKKYLSNPEFYYINDLIKTSDLKKNLFVFELNSKKKIVLISIKKNLKNSDIENLGAEFFGRINHGKKIDYSIILDTIKTKNNNFISHFIHGLKLKSYDFKKYKSKKGK